MAGVISASCSSVGLYANETEAATPTSAALGLRPVHRCPGTAAAVDAYWARNLRSFQGEKEMSMSAIRPTRVFPLAVRNFVLLIVVCTLLQLIA